MMNPDRYYQESGSVSPMGVLSLVGVGTICAAVLGFVYGYAIFYIPLIYLNFFITLFFGIGMGAALGKAGFWGKVRNTKVMIAAGVFFGVLAWYVGWVAWIHAWNGQPLADLTPPVVLNTMVVLSYTGAYEIFGWTPTGFALYAIWFIEAAMIIGGAFLVALVALGRKPFCEECDDWTHESVVSSRLQPIANPKELISSLEQHDMSVLTNLQLVDHNDVLRTKVSFHKCDGCGGSKYLTVDQITVSFDDEGKAEEEVDDIVENLLLSSSDYATIQDWRKTLG
jgi:hypothetical protein